LSIHPSTSSPSPPVVIIEQVYWHRVKSFIDDLPKGTLLADIGSGDGKYFGVNPNVISIGCDRSLKLLEVSFQKEFETFACDAVKLPLQNNMFDATLCIAVMHHLARLAE
jgi:alkylated DNA repair protein alkB family protein 8